MSPSASVRSLTFSLTSMLIATMLVSMMLVSTMAAAQTGASCTFNLFQLPQSTSSIAYDVNDSGTVVGPAPVQSSEKGFIRTASGKATYYCAPGAGCTKYSSSTYFTGLNDSGVGVGVYKTPEMGAPEGFMLKGSTSATIQEPNSA
jgi:hypothetical protein